MIDVLGFISLKRIKLESDNFFTSIFVRTKKFIEICINLVRFNSKPESSSGTERGPELD